MMQVYSAVLEATVEQSARFGVHHDKSTLGRTRTLVLPDDDPLVSSQIDPNT